MLAEKNKINHLQTTTQVNQVNELCGVMAYNLTLSCEAALIFTELTENDHKAAENSALSQTYTLIV